MINIIKDILISQMSFPLKYKNEKEVWWEDEDGNPITIEIIDAENEQYVERGYWDNGQLLYKENYYQRLRHGEQLGWHDDGQIRYKENYHQGYLHGERLVWYKGGQQWIKSNYYQGRQHGERLMWSKNGKLNYKLKYNHGKLINEEHY